MERSRMVVGQRYRPNELARKHWKHAPEFVTLVNPDTWLSYLSYDNQEGYGVPIEPWALFKGRDGSHWSLHPNMVDPIESLVLDLATGDFTLEVVEATGASSSDI